MYLCICIYIYIYVDVMFIRYPWESRFPAGKCWRRSYTWASTFAMFRSQPTRSQISQEYIWGICSCWHPEYCFGILVVLVAIGYVFYRPIWVNLHHCLQIVSSRVALKDAWLGQQQRDIMSIITVAIPLSSHSCLIPLSQRQPPWCRFAARRTLVGASCRRSCKLVGWGLFEKVSPFTWAINELMDM